jgi:general secretion pathway protein C
MERLFKRHFWVVWLLFLATSAGLVARTANVYVATALEPRLEFGVPAAPAARSTIPAAAATAVDANKLGHLFGIEPPPPPPSASETAPMEPVASQAVCFTCEPVKTNLRLQLLGTMVANEKRWSMAVISDLDKQKAGYYFHKDRVKNATIFAIQREPQRVVIVNDETHRLEYIDAVPGTGAVNTAGLGNLGTAPVPPPGDAPPGDAPPPNEAAALEGVKQRSENEYTITRNRLDSTLSNLNDVATQARIVPSFKNGVANGFKLFSIRPGSIYSAIGIQNGDVINRINGFEMNSPDKALEIYTRLKEAKNVEIEVERRGQIVKKRYAIE